MREINVVHTNLLTIQALLIKYGIFWFVFESLDLSLCTAWFAPKMTLSSIIQSTYLNFLRECLKSKWDFFLYFALKERFLRSENFDHKDLFKAIKQLLHTLALMPINCKINQTCRELIELLLNYIITYEFAIKGQKNRAPLVTNSKKYCNIIQLNWAPQNCLKKLRIFFLKIIRLLNHIRKRGDCHFTSNLVT